MAAGALAAPQRRRRPRWSLKTAFFGGILAAGVSLLLAHGLVRADFWRELEWVAAGAAVVLFAFFAVALYRGVRWSPRERLAIDFRPWSRPTGWSGPSDGEWPFTAQADSLGGIVIGLLLDLLLSLLLAVVVATLWWIGANLALVSFAAVFLPLFALFRRSARTVLARGRRSRGDLGMSLRHALLGALAYGGWFYGLLVLIRLLRR